MRWRVEYEGEYPYASGRTLRLEGTTYLIVKEFFADGPSLYTYAIYETLGARRWLGERERLTDAKALVMMAVNEGHFVAFPAEGAA